MPDDQPAEAPKKAPIVTRLKLCLEAHRIAAAHWITKSNPVKAKEHEQHIETLKDAIAFVNRREKSKPSLIPAVEEVLLYASELELPEGEAHRFFDYFQSNGWRVGKSRTPMRDWQAALRNWKRNLEDRLGGESGNGSRPKGDPADWPDFLNERGYPAIRYEGCRDYLRDEFFQWRKEKRRNGR